MILGVHGGAGAVLSVGLLNKVPMNEMERCLRTANRTSGMRSPPYSWTLRFGATRLSRGNSLSRSVPTARSMPPAQEFIFLTFLTF